jgi:hypothetical protein
MCNRRFRHRSTDADCAFSKAASSEAGRARITATGHARLDVVLGQLCHKLTVGSQLADTPLCALDSYLSQLNQLGLFNQSIVLGPVVLRRAHGVDGRTDSGELVQAAITTDFGAAAVYWDSLDFDDVKDSHDFEGEALDRATPLRKCAPAIRSVVWPHVPALVTKLLDRATIE